MKFNSFLVFGVLIAVTPVVMAASTTDLTVTGIITPAACTPLIGGGGNFDFGRISAQDLDQNFDTRFISAPLQLSVSCSAPSLFALRGIDGRPGSVASDQANLYGLGFNGSEKIGVYTIRTPRASYVADGDTEIRSLRSLDNGATWGGGDYADPINGAAGYIYSKDVLSAYSNFSNNQPIAIQQFSTNLQVLMIINAAKDLTLTDEVKIDGAATIEVVYL